MEQSSGTAQKPPVISEWLGYWVFISYMSGPNLDTDDPTRAVKGQAGAVTASFLLSNYGPLGIEVSRNAGDPAIFMSWGAVLYIQGPPPEVREQIDRETAKQTQGNQGK